MMMSLFPQDLIKLSALMNGELKKRSLTITTAESCTGGAIAAVITETAGSSAIINEAYVTYSNEAKQRLVGVSKETLESYGAVSEETVKEMALGAQKKADSSIAIAVSGIAGPSGATTGKPVGTVHICVVIGNIEPEIYHEKHKFDGDRDAVRYQTVTRTLEMVLENLGSWGGTTC